MFHMKGGIRGTEVSLWTAGKQDAISLKFKELLSQYKVYQFWSHLVPKSFSEMVLRSSDR